MNGAREQSGSSWLHDLVSFSTLVSALLYACGIFLVVLKQLRALPPTPAIAIGRVTIERDSKLHDYVAFACFLILVPLLTHLLRPLFARLVQRLPLTEERRAVAAMLLALSQLLAPVLFLTTGKEGWTLLLPPIIGACAALALSEHASRVMKRDESAPLLLIAASWIFFRYVATGKRIAHIPTLFLELAFIAFFVALFVASAALLARLLSMLFGWDHRRASALVVTAALPLLLLPPLSLTLLPPATIMLAVLALVLVAAMFGSRRSLSRAFVRNVVAWCGWPLLLFCFAYASAPTASSWLDLFHRGESLGPASDYLLGKLPYRDVFVLHGMLEDGLLDSWLMTLFGRSPSVAIARIAVIQSLTMPALYLLGLVTFRRVSWALATSLLGMFVFADQHRVGLHIVVIALLIAALRANRVAAFAAGIVSALALFYSLDIGIFCVGGAVVTFVLAASFRQQRNAMLRSATLFSGGVALGAAPFLLYLAANGLLGAWYTTSFVEVPRVIDAVWSLPYPDLGAMFRGDLTLRAISDFILGERIRYVLSPLFIACGVVAIVLLARRRRWSMDALSLLALVPAAAIAQRSALGRADFPHQYFAAYLIPPIALLLLRGVVARAATWRRDSGVAPFLALVSVVGASMAMIALWVPDLLSSRLDSVLLYRPRLSGIGYSDAAAEETRARIGDVTSEIARVTSSRDTLFDFSNQPALYFFAARRNPTRFYQIPIASPLEYQREVIDALTTQAPTIVLRGSPEKFDRFDEISNDARAPYVSAFLDRNYTLWRTVRGIELWRRSSKRVSPVRVASMSVPKSIPAALDQSLILPSIGSIQGAAGAQWRSDLSITNPHRRAVTLSLRYSSARGVVERRLTLPAGHTRLFADVVGRFFGAPESRGSCLIRFAAEGRPLVVATTRDIAREGAAHLETPVDTSAAATAGEASRLVIAGVAQSESRRVNLGITNVGSSSASAQIVLRTSTGQLVGESFTTSIAEGGSFLLVDAGKRLGAPIDASMMIEVRVTRGSCVAYASVIDALSGAQDSVTAVPVE